MDQACIALPSQGLLRLQTMSRVLVHKTESVQYQCEHSASSKLVLRPQSQRLTSLVFFCDEAEHSHKSCGRHVR